MKECVNTACHKYHSGYTDNCGKLKEEMRLCEDYLTETKTDSSVPLNAGLADIQRDMVDAIKEQTAAALAGEIAAQKRHDEEMDKRQGLKEQNVWMQGCNAALCCPAVAPEDALVCGDIVLAGFKERFVS